MPEQNLKRHLGVIQEKKKEWIFNHNESAKGTEIHRVLLHYNNFKTFKLDSQGWCVSVLTR